MNGKQDAEIISNVFGATIGLVQKRPVLQSHLVFYRAILCFTEPALCFTEPPCVLQSHLVFYRAALCFTEPPCVLQSHRVFYIATPHGGSIVVACVDS